MSTLDFRLRQLTGELSDGSFLISEKFQLSDLTCLGDKAKLLNNHRQPMGNRHLVKTTGVDVIVSDCLLPLICKEEICCHVTMVTGQNCYLWEHI